MTKTINVVLSKADQLSVVIPDVTIRITGGVKKFVGKEWAKNARAFYSNQAGLLMKGVLSLPGGTVDQLLLRLLEKKASLYRVKGF